MVELLVEPDPVIQLVIAADSSGDRLIRVTSIVTVVTIEIRQAMTKIPESEQKQNVMPVQDAQSNKRSDKQNQFGHSPESFVWALPLQSAKDSLGIFPVHEPQVMLHLADAPPRRRVRVYK